jgi:hypothetical protein
MADMQPPNIGRAAELEIRPFPDEMDASPA